METVNPQSQSEKLTSKNPALRMAALAEIFMAAPDTDASPQDIAVCLEYPQEDIRAMAVETLGKMGSQAVSFLMEALRPEQPDRVRIAAASCLGRMGFKAEPAAASLACCLESDNDMLAWHAGFALSKIGTPALDPVKEKLSSDNHQTVMAAVQTLGWMEKKAIETVEMIKDLGEKKDPEMNMICAAALVRISGGNGTDLAELLSGLDSCDNELKKRCISEIGLLGDRAKDVQTSLIPCLTDPDPRIRSETALAMARIGHPVPELVNALIPLISDEDTTVKTCTCLALSVYGPKASPALAPLENMAENDDPGICLVAQKAIDAINGPENRPENKGDTP